MENKPIHEVSGLADAARRLRLPAVWLRGEADAGRVPCLRAGPRRLLFNVDAVRRTLAGRAAVAAATSPADRKGATDAR